MKHPKAIIAPIGIVILPERESEDGLLLHDMPWVGYHAYCRVGHVIVREQTTHNSLVCPPCGFHIATFPKEVKTYAALRAYFNQIAAKYL